MTNTVTINIQNNCGCGCDDGASARGPDDDIWDGEWGEIPPPNGTEGPPYGYLPATSVTDRQCRTAIFTYSWVYYLTDQLANTTTGKLYLEFANSEAVPGLVKAGVAKLLIPLVIAVIELLVTAGIEISDTLGPIIAFTIASTLVGFLTDFVDKNNITPTKLQDVYAKLPNCQDQIICTLSKSTSETVRADLEALLKDPVFDLSETQQGYIVIIAGTMSKMLYYTPEWWPSFDTETLSSITANCCGSFVDGTALLPSSTEGCQTSWYIVDKLRATFNGIQEYWNWYWKLAGINWNPFDDDTAEILEDVTAQIDTYLPRKVIQKAGSRIEFYRSIALYINHQTFSLNSWGSIFDYNWSNLSAELSAQAPAIRADLQAALDINDVYDAIYTPLETWIDANVADTELNTYMKNAINALIEPTGSTEDYLNMMFYQDADLATYADAECAGIADPITDTPSAQCGGNTGVGTYDFSNGQYNWLPYGHLVSVVFDLALGEFRGTSYGAGTMQLTQDAPQNVQSITVHYRATSGVNFNMGAGNVGNQRQQKLTAGGVGSVTFTNLCITNTTAVFVIAYINSGNFVAITEIEFHQ